MRLFDSEFWLYTRGIQPPSSFLASDFITKTLLDIVEYHERTPTYKTILNFNRIKTYRRLSLFKRKNRTIEQPNT
jgi:hypothetical protein